MPSETHNSVRGLASRSVIEQASPIGKSWFLGIGINIYRYIQHLSNAQKDIQDVQTLLTERYDLDESRVIFNEQATKGNIIDQFQYLMDELGENDKLIIYYSGHGYLDKKNDRGYWLPYEAENRRVATYLRNSEILEFLEDINARHILLISDSCFSGTLLRSVDMAQSTMADWEKYRSRWVVASGRRQERVADGKAGKNSPFTASVLQVLRENQETGLNVGLFCDKVSKLTRHRHAQTPEGAPLLLAGDDGGQYIFRLNKPMEKLGQSEVEIPAKREQEQKLENPGVERYEPFTDPRDEQTYETMTINGLRWMAENLNYDPGQGCWWFDDDPQKASSYGRLYTWEAAQLACPPGWRLPTDEEWKGLLQSLGGYFDLEIRKTVGNPEKAYNSLIETGSSNICIKLGGQRHSAGNFDALEQYGYYWSATQNDPERAWAYFFYRYFGEVYRGAFGKSFGFSCRCVQDAEPLQGMDTNTESEE